MCLCDGFFPTPRFYNASRAKATAEMKARPSECECALCRGTWVQDTPEGRAAHVAHHKAIPFTKVCGCCGEDVCQRLECQAFHRSQCSEFRSLNQALAAETITEDEADLWLERLLDEQVAHTLTGR